MRQEEKPRCRHRFSGRGNEPGRRDLSRLPPPGRRASEPNGILLLPGVAIDQIAGAAQRLDNAQAATGSLVESLNAAAQRFEGVDRELANTLKELQTGLQGFTKQIGTFVGQTDQNLAKAATHLGSLVKGLQDTLEDFAPAGAHGPELHVNG